MPAFAWFVGAVVDGTPDPLTNSSRCVVHSSSFRPILAAVRRGELLLALFLLGRQALGGAAAAFKLASLCFGSRHATVLRPNGSVHLILYYETVTARPSEKQHQCSPLPNGCFTASQAP
jgi:hypothetical protein